MGSFQWDGEKVVLKDYTPLDDFLKELAVDDPERHERLRLVMRLVARGTVKGGHSESDLRQMPVGKALGYIRKCSQELGLNEQMDFLESEPEGS